MVQYCESARFAQAPSRIDSRQIQPTPTFIRDARVSSRHAVSVEQLLDLAREAKRRDRKR
jgi:hypothetical protein